MTTTKKILVGTAVVAGVYLIYKAVSTNAKTTATGTRPATGIGATVSSAFVTLGTSIAGALSKPSPAPTATPAVGYSIPSDAYQSSAASAAYASEAGGVLPENATPADYAAGDVVYGPFVGQ